MVNRDEVVTQLYKLADDLEDCITELERGAVSPSELVVALTEEFDYNLHLLIDMVRESVAE